MKVIVNVLIYPLMKNLKMRNLIPEQLDLILILMLQVREGLRFFWLVTKYIIPI